MTGYARSCVKTPNGGQVECGKAVVGVFWKIRREVAKDAVVVAVVMRRWSVVRDGDTSVA